MLNMTETDYENWRDDLRCGGQEEYDTQYSAASLYEGGWRSDAISDLIEQFNLTGDEAERIYNELLEIEQKAEDKGRCYCASALCFACGFTRCRSTLHSGD